MSKMFIITTFISSARDHGYCKEIETGGLCAINFVSLFIILYQIVNLLLLCLSLYLISKAKTIPLFEKSVFKRFQLCYKFKFITSP